MDADCSNRESFSDFSGSDVEGEMGWTGNGNWETFAELTALVANNRNDP